MSADNQTEPDRIVHQISDEIDEMVELYESRLEQTDNQGTMEIHEQLCHLHRKLDEAVEYTSAEEAQSNLFGDE